MVTSWVPSVFAAAPNFFGKMSGNTVRFFLGGPHYIPKYFEVMSPSREFDPQWSFVVLPNTVVTVIESNLFFLSAKKL